MVESKIQKNPTQNTAIPHPAIMEELAATTPRAPPIRLPSGMAIPLSPLAAANTVPNLFSGIAF